MVVAWAKLYQENPEQIQPTIKQPLNRAQGSAENTQMLCM